MKKPELTPWFDGSIKPVHVGPCAKASTKGGDMKSYLICYEIGINDGNGTAPGHCTLDMIGITKDDISKISATLRQQFIETNPTITSVQNLVFRSIVELDQA